MARQRKANDQAIRGMLRERLDELVDELTGEIRRMAFAEVAGFVGERAGLFGAGGKPKANGKANGKRKAKRILPCIKPACGKPSKGPRFRYLCDEHKGAGKKEIEGWRKANAAKAAA